MRGDVLAAAVALLLCVCGTKAQLGATWIPTDLNYALISSLRGNALQAPGDQLAGESPLLQSGSMLFHQAACRMGPSLQAMQRWGSFLLTWWQPG